MFRSLRTTAMLTAFLIPACSVARQGEVPVPAIEVLRTPDSIAALGPAARER